MILFELCMLGGAVERRYRRMRPEVEQLPWGTLSPKDHAPELVLAARRTWTQAAFQEHRTGAACAATLEALIAARAPLDLIALCTRFPLDELAHVVNREGGFLTSWRPDQFDAAFFGISPREAGAMDPQQRLLLEVAWEALEHAGVALTAVRAPHRRVRRSDTDDYYVCSARRRRRRRSTRTCRRKASSFAAGRMSYFLGLHGPAVVLDTACSSSLVAIHLACQSLRRRETDLALAGGANLILPPGDSIALFAVGHAGARRPVQDLRRLGRRLRARRGLRRDRAQAAQ